MGCRQRNSSAGFGVQGTGPEDRWWLYTMTVATTGQTMQKGTGWRKALRAALADNPLSKAKVCRPKRGASCWGNRNCSYPFEFMPNSALAPVQRAQAALYSIATLPACRSAVDNLAGGGYHWWLSI